MRHYIKLLGIIAAVFFSGYFLELAAYAAEEYIEIFTEISIVFVAFSIFAMTWYAYGKSRDNHSLFLGATFLIVGVLSLLHTFSFSFMPDFITPNSPQKVALFWGEARIFLAVFILASVFIYHDSLPGFINRSVLFIFSVFSTLISIIPVLFYSDLLPPMFSSENGVSAGMVLLLALTTGISLYAAYLYVIRIRNTGQKNIMFLIDGLIIVTVSNLVYFSHEFSGHLLMVTGFYFIHLSLYRSSVELPYEKLAEAEDRLRKAAEERYKNLFDNASDAIITVNLKEDITSWNQAAEKIFGWNAEEVVGKNFSDILVPRNKLDRKEEIINYVISGGVISGLDVICMHKNGAAVDVSLSVSPLRDANLNIIGMSGILRDISERKRAEKLIRESEERYRNLVELTTDVIYMSDREGIQIFMNDAGCRILEASPEEVVGHEWSRWIHPDDREKTLTKFREMIEKGIDVFDFENRYISKNGTVKNVLHNVRVVRNEKGEIIGTQGIARDITELKKAEEIRMENLHLAFASKAKSEFLANMSHELRTPLNSIIGFSELMRQKMPGELNEKQMHYMDNILKSSKFLLDLINDILDLSKVEAGKIELVIEKMSVPLVIDETLILIKEKAAKHNVLLIKELDPSLGSIEADQQRFKQVLFNLLSNAVKFSKPEGGTVKIKTKEDGDMAIFSVADTGIGIKEEDIGKLFRTFEQLDSGISRNYGGTGLGLAISKKLVELHNGEISAESRYGEGSTFTFSLPIRAKGKWQVKGVTT